MSERSEAIGNWIEEVLGGLETGGDEYEFVTVKAGGIEASTSMRSAIERYQQEEK